MPRAKSTKVPKKDTPVPPPTPEEYGEFIKGIEIENISLVDCSAKRIKIPEPESILKYSVIPLDSTYDSKSSGFSVIAGYEIQLMCKSPESQEEVFANISVSLECSYISEISINQALFQVFKDVNVPLNIWPYAREIVHSLSNRMGLATLILPAFKNT